MKSFGCNLNSIEMLLESDQILRRGDVLERYDRQRERFLYKSHAVSLLCPCSLHFCMLLLPIIWCFTLYSDKI